MFTLVKLTLISILKLYNGCTTFVQPRLKMIKDNKFVLTTLSRTATVVQLWLPSCRDFTQRKGCREVVQFRRVCNSFRIPEFVKNYHIFSNYYVIQNCNLYCMLIYYQINLYTLSSNLWLSSLSILSWALLLQFFDSFRLKTLNLDGACLMYSIVQLL